MLFCFRLFRFRGIDFQRLEKGLCFACVSLVSNIMSYYYLEHYKGRSNDICLTMHYLAMLSKSQGSKSIA